MRDISKISINVKQNIWNIDIWIAEELFDYLHPFLFPNLFKLKLTSHQFQVLFEVIKVYTSHDIRKEFYIKRFLDNYPSVLSNKQKFQDKVLDPSSNKILNIHDLNISHLTIAVFENINIKFS